LLAVASVTLVTDLALRLWLHNSVGLAQPVALRLLVILGAATLSMFVTVAITGVAQATLNTDDRLEPRTE
jgi:hypothetical protein